jgi:hypothetical protein
MTPQAALDVATAFLDAFTAGDLDHTATYLADDFTFDGPIAHYRSAEEFLTGSRPFVETLHPGWTRIAAFGDDHHALLLYDLTLQTGATMRIADHYTVDRGKIRTETILWDTGRSRP